MTKTGGCLCGAVRYEVSTEVEDMGACHCSMCRNWSGGVFLAFRVPEDGMTFTGEENIGIYKSSPWAERAFCQKCGSSLFYRVTAPGPYQGNRHVGVGTLDDADGIPLVGEMYIDLKPDGYAFAQQTHTMTQAEVEAMFAEYAEG